MAKQLKILVISGWGETVNDGGPIWDIADQLAALPGCIVTRRAWDEVIPSDLVGIDAVICHSYGMAGFMRTLLGIAAKDRPPIGMLFCIVGVPRFWWGQFYCWCWQIPACIAQAVAFNLYDWPENFPASQEIRNPSANYINVNCQGDRPVLAGGKLGETYGHVSIPRDPRVVNTILDWAKSQLSQQQLGVAA